jgi:hypothetical protein
LIPVANEYILRCNDQAPAAFAASMRRLRTSTDTAALNGMVLGAMYVQDSGFFAAAYEVSTDPSASPQARTAGPLVAATELTDKWTFDYHKIVATPGLWICPSEHYDHSQRLDGGAPVESHAVS